MSILHSTLAYGSSASGRGYRTILHRLYAGIGIHPITHSSGSFSVLNEVILFCQGHSTQNSLSRLPPDVTTMACTCLLDDEAKAQLRVSKAIEREMEQWKKDASKEFKLLLLGEMVRV